MGTGGAGLGGAGEAGQEQGRRLVIKSKLNKPESSKNGNKPVRALRMLKSSVLNDMMLLAACMNNVNDDDYVSGYNSTPHYDDRSTPRHGSSGGRTPSERSGGGRTPGGRTPGGPGGRTPVGGGGSRTPQDRRSGDRQRTPRGHFGDATPLYDE